jgi:hypothetical protein
MRSFLLGFATVAATVVVAGSAIAVFTAAASSGALPFTSTPIWLMLGIAGALILAGALLLLPGRKGE